MSAHAIRRTINPEVRVIDNVKGIVEYVASDETLDSYKEVIRVNGWKFTNFKKNAPFVDSHNYGSVDKLLGRVIDFQVKGNKLVETVQWAKDVPENKLAQLGWSMTEAGYLRAVSVGFYPVKMVAKWDQDQSGYNKALRELGLEQTDEAKQPRAVYLQQEQVELSAVVIGANPNALAKAYKAGVIDDAGLTLISENYSTDSGSSSTEGVHVDEHRERRRRWFLWSIERNLNT
jgi:hypothetical protein